MEEKRKKSEKRDLRMVYLIVVLQFPGGGDLLSKILIFFKNILKLLFGNS